MNYISITLLAFASAANAVCTGYEGIGTLVETASSFSTRFLIPLENIACESSKTSDCMFEYKTYHITARRDLAKGGLISYNDLPSDELDSIFNFAQEYFFRHVPTNSTLNRDFMPREANISSSDADPSFLSIKPGQNKTLGYVPFYQHVAGILSGCSNTSLNNFSLEASAPYLQFDKNNNSVLAGTWLADYHNITSAASGRVHAMSIFGATMAALAVGLVF